MNGLINFIRCSSLLTMLLNSDTGRATGGFAALGECALNATQYRGWNGYQLTNGLVAVYIIPDIGGRVIQYQLAGHDYFFVNPLTTGKVFPPEENGGGNGGWKNYGGDKLWPAPQGWENDQQWPGPPDPVLDGGKYSAAIVRQTAEEVAVRLTSPPDPRTGIQFSRTVTLSRGTTRVRVESTMKNISQRPVRWSIWEVIQQDTADPSSPGQFNPDFWAYCPLNPQSRYAQGYYPIFGQVGHPSYQPDPEHGLLGVRYDYRVGKVGLDSHGGWLTTVNGKSDHCFVARFPYFPKADYPDGASVEFWLNGAGEFILNRVPIVNPADPQQTPYLMETEILSPLAELQPGEDYHFNVDWFATRCPRPVVDVVPAGAINRRLLASVRGRQVRVEGVFGVFMPGHAEATFYTRDGTVAGKSDLGRVEPNQVFRLASELPLPENAFRVSVAVIDSEGQNHGWLGNAFLDR